MNAADAELPLEFLQPRTQPNELRRDFGKRQSLLATDTGSRSTSPRQKAGCTRHRGKFAGRASPADPSRSSGRSAPETLATATDNSAAGFGEGQQEKGKAISS